MSDDGNSSRPILSLVAPIVVLTTLRYFYGFETAVIVGLALLTYLVIE